MPEMMRACDVAVMPSSFRKAVNFCRCFSVTSLGDSWRRADSKNCVSFSRSERYADTEWSANDFSSCSQAL